MKWRVFAFVIVFIILMVSWSRKETKKESDTDNRVLSDSIRLVSQIEFYADNPKRVDDLVARAHPMAFDFAYKEGTPGFKRREEKPVQFDNDQYLQWLFINLRREIRKDIEDAFSNSEVRELKDLQGQLEQLRKKQGIKGLPGS